MFGLFSPGVAVREMGDFDLSDMADEIFWDVRRSAGSIAAASGCAAGRPFASAGACAMSTWKKLSRLIQDRVYLLPRALRGSFDTVPALDNVCLQADRTRSAVELEEQAASVAEHGAGFIATPERGGTCRAVLAYRLQWIQCAVSDCGHIGMREGEADYRLRQIDKEFKEIFKGKAQTKLTGALADAPPGVADIV
jgi:hypothetical protein